MPYMSDTEKRYRIFSLFCFENEPRTILEIARHLGYKDSNSLRNVLNSLETEGMFRKHEQLRHNGSTRFLYVMVAGYENERERLGRLLKTQKYNGIT